jgi:hypothetical protein
MMTVIGTYFSQGAGIVAAAAGSSLLLPELLELLELLNSFLRCGSSILTSTFILKKYRPTR